MKSSQALNRLPTPTDRFARAEIKIIKKHIKLKPGSTAIRSINVKINESVPTVKVTKAITIKIIEMV